MAKGLYRFSIISFMMVLQFALITSGLSAPLCCHNFSAKADIMNQECACCQNTLINFNQQECPYCKEGCVCKHHKKRSKQIPAPLAQIFSILEEISYAGIYVIPSALHREKECFKNFIRTYTPKSNKLDILRTIVMLN